MLFLNMFTAKMCKYRRFNQRLKIINHMSTHQIYGLSKQNKYICLDIMGNQICQPETSAIAVENANSNSHVYCVT